MSKDMWKCPNCGETAEDKFCRTCFSEYVQRRKSFWHERQLDSELESNEVPFAVIVPHADSDKDSRRALAQALETWRSHHPLVKRILGLHKMLKGELPEVATVLLMIPMSDDPSSWVEKVALVTVTKEDPELAKSLSIIDENFSWVSIFSWELYSYMNR